MKKLLFSFLILFSGISFGQTNDRVEVHGTITVPAGAEMEGITIYNKNAAQGTVSSEKGEFTLPVKVRDSLYFSAVQYRGLLIEITKDIVDSQTLVVEIHEGLNELPEVVLRSHDLSGLVENDVKNIKVEKVPLPAYSAVEVNKLFNPVMPDGQSGVPNAALGEKGGPPTAFNILGFVSALGSLVIPKREKPVSYVPKYSMNLIKMDQTLRSRYDNAFFKEVLKIAPHEIPDFIEFVHAKGIADRMLEKKSEMDLLQFLIERSVEFNTEFRALKEHTN